jgi:hypothetical protein
VRRPITTGAGFVDASAFTTAQCSNGTGLFMVCMRVPGSTGPTGSSPDFASGPVRSNVLFPLTFSGDNFTGGTVAAG